MKKLLLGALLALVVLAGCAEAIPYTDWCFRFDFTHSNYGVSVSHGTWVAGEGFIPDDAGVFDLSYEQGDAVTPVAAVLSGIRDPASNMLPIHIEGEAIIFGIDSGFVSSDVPENTNSGSAVLKAGSGSAPSSSFLIYGVAASSIAFQSLEVLGNGDNPFPQNNCADFVSPTSSAPTPIPFSDGQLLQGLNQADQQISGISPDLTAPNGSAILPDETGTTIFSYAKWLVSPATANELLGPFAPVYIHVGFFLAMDVAMVGVYIVIYSAVYVARWLIWLFRLILQIVQSIASAASGVVGWLLSFVGL